MTDNLSYYTNHSPITDPGQYTYLYDGLPDEPGELFPVINGVLLHRYSADRHKMQLTRQQRREQRLRMMKERLAYMMKYDPAPLTTPRDTKDMQIGWCRDFAVFLVSILRHKGIPARMRVGFEAYFAGRTFNGDHWVTEYWDQSQSKWRMADSDVGGMDPEFLEEQAKTKLKPGIDLTDIRQDEEFSVAGRIWNLARAGEVKAEYYRANKTWKGWPVLRGNLLHDFQALNHLELGLFDYWDDLHRKPINELTAKEYTLLDKIADLTHEPEENFEEMRDLFEELPRTKVLRSRLRVLGVTDEIQVVDPDDLKSSGLDRLMDIIEENGGTHKVDKEKSHTVRNTKDTLSSTPEYPAGTNGSDSIIVQGARQHNLKNIDVQIPRNKIVVVTGVSGSGKSSLAFDTIYAEGQRRYMESLSSLARQFTKQMEKPKVDRVLGLNPAIAIEQKTISRTPRSTVGSVTEIVDYLRVLFARIGLPHCPQCGQAVHPMSSQLITNRLSMLQSGTEIQLLAPVNRNRWRKSLDVLQTAIEEGIVKARVDGEIMDLISPEGLPPPDEGGEHDIELILGQFSIPEEPSQHEWGEFLTQLMKVVEATLEKGKGTMIVHLDREEIMLSEDNACPVCEINLPKIEPQLFNFNNVLGMCTDCDGLGLQLQVDPDLIISKPHKSLMEDATTFHLYSNLRKSSSAWWKSFINSIAEHFGADLEKPWNELPEEFRKTLIFGSEGKKIYLEYETEDGSLSVQREREIQGAVHQIQRLYRQTKSESQRRRYMQFMNQLPCPTCEGERLCVEARFVTLDGKRFPELSSISIRDLHEWINNLEGRLEEDQQLIAEELLAEIKQRLGFITKVGLHYLTLDRSAPTLSGGEGQRIRLAKQIGSGLMGVLYILDEPSIGLHPRDQRDLLHTLCRLRDEGNTVLVVEHDAETMLTSDYLIDLGPGAGVLGGEVVAAGTPEEVMDNPDSLTGRYLSGEMSITTQNGSQERSPDEWLTIKGSQLHNLKNIDARIPLNTFTCVTGVSGSGKSSLINRTLQPALARALGSAQDIPGPYDSIEGIEMIDKVISIDQKPIGRNPRSNPGTYIGALSEIRKVFANTEEAKALKYSAGHFSFNVNGGRCEECEGYGAKKVKLHFLADVWVKCKECDGKRFNPQTLEVRYKGKNIADVLDMDVQEALTLFQDQSKINRILQTLQDVGMDYIKLGQSALTLSGGEAQRIKLAKELGRRSTGNILYVLDEPTVGLHFADIQRLLDMLHRLVDSGNTVVVIEHNLDVIKTADWIIDLGPEGGDEGGYIVAEGTVDDIIEVDESHTGRFLREVYEGKKVVKAQ